MNSRTVQSAGRLADGVLRLSYGGASVFGLAIGRKSKSVNGASSSYQMLKYSYLVIRSIKKTVFTACIGCGRFAKTGTDDHSRHGTKRNWIQSQECVRKHVVAVSKIVLRVVSFDF